MNAHNALRRLFSKNMNLARRYVTTGSRARGHVYPVSARTMTLSRRVVNQPALMSANGIVEDSRDRRAP